MKINTKKKRTLNRSVKIDIMTAMGNNRLFGKKLIYASLLTVFLLMGTACEEALSDKKDSFFHPQQPMDTKTLFSGRLTADDVRLLIKQGADPNEREKSMGDTPLMRAERGDVIRALIECGADVHAVNNFGQNMVHSMAFRQEPEEDYMRTVIDEACKVGLSLDAPVGVDAPLFLAVYSDAEPTVEYLLEQGASPHALSSEEGIVSETYTALNYAATVAENTINTLMLLHAGAGDEEVEQKWTSLHRAAIAGNVGEVASLLSSGVSPDIRGVLECTPLMGAAMFGHTEVVKLLVAAGADIEARNKLAAWNGQNEVIRYLLSQGADPNIAGNRKLRALHIAVWRGKEDTARLLLESGADPNVIAGENEDEWRASPLFFAKKGSSIYQLLIQFGAKAE